MESIGPLCLDVETTTWNNGNPFDRRNSLVCIAWATETDSGCGPPTPEFLEEIKNKITRAEVIVGFNIKFDLHWLMKHGVDTGDVRIYDCQIGEFLLTNQQVKYPSLEGCLVKYNLGHKYDVVKNEYWAKGINTNEIPWDILSEYAIQDVRMTLALYKHQLSLMGNPKRRLCMLQCLDLKILQIMEYNGLKYDEDLCEERARGIEEKIRGITNQLSSIYVGIPINFNSGDDLSAFLYGGTIVETRKKHIGFFKSGQKIGQPRYQNEEVRHELPRLVEPLRGSELKKKGFYATNADTLLKLKPSKKTKELVGLIQQQVRLDTLLSKSYNGIRKANREQNWEPGWLHGQFNQVTVSTGRLSSSNPNLQNIDSDAQDLLISRYDE